MMVYLLLVILQFPIHGLNGLFQAFIALLDSNIGIIPIQRDPLSIKVNQRLARPQNHAATTDIMQPGLKRLEINGKIDDRAKPLQMAHGGVTVDDAAARGNDAVVGIKGKTRSLLSSQKCIKPLGLDNLTEAKAGLPLVGSIVSDSLGTTVAILGLVKGALGRTGLLLVAAQAAGPAAALFLHGFALRAASALLLSLEQREMGTMLQALGEMLTVLGALILAAGVMLCVTVSGAAGCLGGSL